MAKFGKPHIKAGFHKPAAFVPESECLVACNHPPFINSLLHVCNFLYFVKLSESPEQTWQQR